MLLGYETYSWRGVYRSTFHYKLILSFFLSGLRWHLPGLSDLSLKRLFLLLHLRAGLSFSYKIAIYFEVCSFHFPLVGQFLYKSMMYEHVAVEHLLFQVLQHRKHYTAHHKRLTRRRSASAFPSESDNASKQTEFKSGHNVEHL